MAAATQGSCSPPLVELRHSACSFHGNWGGSLHPRASHSSTATQTEGRRRSIFELGQVSLSTGAHRPSPGWLARPHCPSLSTSWEWGGGLRVLRVSHSPWRAGQWAVKRGGPSGTGSCLQCPGWVALPVGGAGVGLLRKDGASPSTAAPGGSGPCSSSARRLL